MRVKHRFVAALLMAVAGLPSIDAGAWPDFVVYPITAAAPSHSATRTP